MQALVTGATGFIGGHVARTLLEAGWSVRCLARPTSAKEHLADLELTWVTGDVRDSASLRAAMRGCDAVFHAAAYYALWSADPSEFHAVNVEGTRRVLEAAQAEGVKRVVYTSSVACIGQAPPGGLASEDTVATAADLCGDYKVTKFEAERVALAAAEAGQDVVVVNPGAVIGPGDVKPTPTGKIIVDFLAGKMPFYMDTGLNFVDVRDVARGHLLAFEKGQAGRRYILGNRDGNKTLKEFLEVVGRVTGRRPPRFKIPYSVAWMAGAVSTIVADVTGREPGVPLNGVKMARHRMFFDPSRAVAELGLPQTPLEETVRDAVAWFQSAGAAPVALPSERELVKAATQALAWLGRWIGARPLTVAALGLLVTAGLSGLAAAHLGMVTSRLELVGGDLPWAERHLALEEEFGDLNAIVLLLEGEDPARLRSYAAELDERVRARPRLLRSAFYRVDPQELGGRALLFFSEARLRELDARLARLAPALRQGALAGGIDAFRLELERRLREGPTMPGQEPGQDASEDTQAGLGRLALRLLQDTELALGGAAPATTPLDVVEGWDTAGYAWVGPEEERALLVLVDYVDPARRPPEAPASPGAVDVRGALPTAPALPADAETHLDPRADAVAALRAITSDLGARYPDVRAGLTGKPVLEVDEMRTYERDTIRTTLVALVGVGLLLVLFFRRLLGPLLIGLCLAMAVLSTLGLATLWPGHLNLMAVVFVVIVIGLGVDFGIHLVARYDEDLARGRLPGDALIAALTHTGPPILAGALTTAGAFGVAWFTGFRGLREFGVIAAFGVVASVVIMLTVLPALVLGLDRARRWLRPQARVGGAGRELPTAGANALWIDFATQGKPLHALMLVGLFSIGALTVAPQVRYDANLLHLQDPQLPSVQLEERLLRDQQVAGWFLAYPSRDLAELARVASRVAALPGVARTESVLDLLPPRQAERLPWVRSIQARLAPLAAARVPDGRTNESIADPGATGQGEAGPAIGRFEPLALSNALRRLRDALEDALDEALTAGREDALAPLEELLLTCERALTALDAALRPTPAPPRAPPIDEPRADQAPGPGAAGLTAVAAYDARLRAALVARARGLSAPAAQPLTPATLPPSLRDRFVGDQGSYLLRIYPRGDLWRPDVLERFVSDVRAAAPDVTGVPILVLESSRVMLQGYRDAGLYALGVVVALLLLLFRRVGLTLLALASLALGGLWLVGLMGLLDLELNPANLVALPLLLGVGIDTTVHVIHRMRAEQARAAAASLGPPVGAAASPVLPVIGSSLGRSLLYSALTSAVGFGSLVFADHPGTASIGSTIALGVLCCLAAGVSFPPAVLALVAWRSRRAT